MKPMIWMGSSKKDLADFPADARRMAGFQLGQLQAGGEPSDWKPMQSIGAGVREIRITEESGAFRVIYLAQKADGVYVCTPSKRRARKPASGTYI